ncbi:ferredoxin [Desulfomarina profundi]|uniref:Ferredoxin n=1 Tax=Desulfomarina profundi TaxID=2772557 RepID=A0A8D5FX10_9BACT|nr:ASKHA domain-containing protein [Desulfomarina profundi]BCL63189.1 ferredoxin [Desulfomarina profundi]
MKHTVQFLPDKRTITVDHGENLLAAAAKAGVYIHAFCGGDGVCGKCKVQLLEGELEAGNSAALTGEEINQSIHLACISSIVSDSTIQIPEIVQSDGRALKSKPKTTRSLSAESLEILVGEWQIAPPVRKLFLKLPPPTLDDNISDMQRLFREIKKHLPDNPEPDYDHPELIRELPFILREADWEVTLILLHGKGEEEPDRIIAVEPGDTTDQLYGLAIDLGTTTICGVLLDLNSGEVVEEGSGYNSQIGYGEDVISRIVYSQRSGGLRILQEKVVYTINTIIEDICKKIIINPSDISYIMAAGNTVMSHLLLGIDPKYIREAPYVPSVNQFPLTKAADLGIMAHPSVRLFLYPCVASYVGGDIVAGVHSCQMHKSDAITLFIDIGTNGEIVVGNKDWMVCAACSAGPAFEGGGIKFGMRASSGAIENFHIHGETFDPMIVTIGATKPRGICGSGLISIVPELLDAGIINQRGKFVRDHNHPRIRKGTDGWEYVIAWSHDSLIGEDIVITEIDLDNLIRAKGAMFAGYQTLLTSVGLSFDDLDRIILAGNFGAHIDLERAISIGLLPDIDRNNFFYLGNASMLGCQISLTDHRRFRERAEVRTLMTNLELSDNIDFMNHYMAALFLPHTDLDLFPNVGRGNE